MTGSNAGIVRAVGAIVFVLGLSSGALAALDSMDPSSGAVVTFSSDGSEDAASGIIYLTEGSHSVGVVYTNADGTFSDASTLSFASDDPSVQVDGAVGDGGSLNVLVNPGASANLFWWAIDGSSGSVQIVAMANQDPAAPPPENPEIAVP